MGKAETVGWPSAGGLAENKAVAVLCIWLTALLGCWAAKKLHSTGSSNSSGCRGALLCFGNALASGTLLAVGLVHMLPDATESLDGFGDLALFVAATIAGSAFVFLVVLSKVAGGCKSRVEGLSLETGGDGPLQAEGGGAGRGQRLTEARSFVLFFALSFHSVMEGLGFGSAQDMGLLVSVFVAMIAHKGLAAFALGCSMAQSELLSWKFWVFAFIFSAGTPLGCLLGAFFTGGGVGDAASRRMASGVCVALASGTFLQVCSMELLPRALAGDQHESIASTGLVLGFLGMSYLGTWC